MKREDFLKAFAGMSLEDQEEIRTEITKKRETGEEETGGGPMAICHEMMEKMKAGENPMTVCHEMMEKMAGKCC